MYFKADSSPKDGKPLRMIAGKYEWSGAREVGDCSVRIVQADINYDDGELGVRL